VQLVPGFVEEDDVVVVGVVFKGDVVQ
jgi:hypothetical protein